MDIENLIRKIIPPADYKHRNGFNNIPIIDKLAGYEKSALENALIHKLIEESPKDIDTLIIETLAYLQSQKSLPLLKNLFEKAKDDLIKLIIASSIFEINKDNNTIDEAIRVFERIKNIDPKNPYYDSALSDAFYQLSKFKNEKTNNIIRQFINDKNYIIANNAKRFLNEEKKDVK